MMRKLFVLLGMVGLWMLALAGSAGAADNVGESPGFGFGWSYGAGIVTIYAPGDYTLTALGTGGVTVNQILINTTDPVILRLVNNTGGAMAFTPTAVGSNVHALYSPSASRLTLDITGPVTLTGQGMASGIRAQGQLTLIGTGSVPGALTAKGTTSNTSGALYCGGTLTMGSGVAVTAENTGTGHGVMSGGAMTISGGSLEGIAANSASAHGVYSAGAMTVSGGSLKGKAEGDDGYGVHSNTTLTVSGGSLTGSGGGALTQNGYGVYSAGAMTVSGGSLDGNGAGLTGYGVFCRGPMTVTSGSLTGSGTGTSGQGVFSLTTMTVTGGSLTGSATGWQANGVRSNGAMDFSGTAQVTGTAAHEGSGVVCNGTLTIADQAVCKAVGPGLTNTNDTLLLAPNVFPLLKGTAPRLYVQNTSRGETHQVDRDPASTQAFLLGGNVTSAGPLTNQNIRVTFPQNSTGWVSVGAAPVPTVGPGGVPPTGDDGHIGVYLLGLLAAVSLSIFVEKRRKRDAKT